MKRKTLKVEEELHKKLKQQALELGISLEQLVNQILKQHI